MKFVVCTVLPFSREPSEAAQLHVLALFSYFPFVAATPFSRRSVIAVRGVDGSSASPAHPANSCKESESIQVAHSSCVVG